MVSKLPWQQARCFSREIPRGSTRKYSFSAIHHVSYVICFVHHYEAIGHKLYRTDHANILQDIQKMTNLGTQVVPHGYRCQHWIVHTTIIHSQTEDNLSCIRISQTTNLNTSSVCPTTTCLGNGHGSGLITPVGTPSRSF